MNLFNNLTAQQAASSALGIAAGSRPLSAAQIESNSPPKTLLYQKIIVPAGGSYPIVAAGDYVYVESVVYDTFALYNVGIAYTTPTIRTDTAQATVQLLESRREIQFPVPFNNLQIVNPNPNIAVIVTLWIGFGQVRRDDSRRMKDAGTGVLLSNIAYAANRVIGSNPIVFQEVSSTSNQRGRIKKASCAIDMSATAAAAVTAGADFTLWLSVSCPPVAADNSVFKLSQNFTGGVAYMHPIQIRFPSFVTGGAGSDAAICEVADLDIEFATTYKETYGVDYYYSLFGQVVANAAFSPGAIGALRFILTVEQG